MSILKEHLRESLAQDEAPLGVGMQGNLLDFAILEAQVLSEDLLESVNFDFSKIFHLELATHIYR